MTAYNFIPANTMTKGVKERKEARKKQLEEVRARRKVIYRQFQKKRQLQADSDLL